MINKNELRLGNWVIDANNETRQIICLDVRWDYEHLKPIPLTEEILLKCGFENGGYDLLFWYKDDIELYGFNHLDNDNYALLKHPSISDKNLRIYSLHQLQNLYFALTNQELNIEL